MRRPESADSIAPESKAYFGGNFISNKQVQKSSVERRGKRAICHRIIQMSHSPYSLSPSHNPVARAPKLPSIGPKNERQPLKEQFFKPLNFTT